jgi:two-component system NarL family sensor kinase
MYNYSFQLEQFAEGLLYGVLMYYTYLTILISLLVRLKGFYYFSLYLLLGVMYCGLKSEKIRMLTPYLSNEFFDILEYYLLSSYLIILILFTMFYLKSRISFTKILDKAFMLLLFICVMLLFFNITNDIFHYLGLNYKKLINAITFQSINLSIAILLVAQYFKIREKQLLIIMFTYFSIFSLLFFNPLINVSNFFNPTFNKYLLYSSGLIVGIVLTILTILRAYQIRKNTENVTKELKNTNLEYAYTLIEGQEREKRRFAEELHDNIGISLVALKMKIANEATNIEDKIEINSSIDKLCKKIREVSHDLLPPTLTRFGIEEALTDLKSHYKKHQLSLLYISNQTSLNQTTEQICFRIIKNIIQLVQENSRGNIGCIVENNITLNAITIKINYSGNNFPKYDKRFESSYNAIRLLGGIFQTSLKNIWDNQIEVIIPYL